MYFDLPPEPPAQVSAVSNESELAQLLQSKPPRQQTRQLDLSQLLDSESDRSDAVRPLDLEQLNGDADELSPNQSADDVSPDSGLPGSDSPDGDASDSTAPIEGAEETDTEEIDTTGESDADGTEIEDSDDVDEFEREGTSENNPEENNPEEASEEIDPEEELTDEELTDEEFISQLQLTADFQSYNPNTQIITARGSVVLRLNDAIIEADELWLNLINRYALADGDVLLTRGAQIVRGDRAEYNFIQQAGNVRNAVGAISLPDTTNDFSSPLEARRASVPTATRRAYDPIARPDNASITEAGSGGSIFIGTDDDTDITGSDDEGSLEQLRFETDSLAFDVEGWRAEDVRITNDPFSPPELEVRARSLVLRNVSPTQDELLLQRPRLVFDQGLSLPLMRRRILLSRGTVNTDDLNPVPVSLGIDGRDRGGIYAGRRVPLIRSDRTRLSITPQFFITRAFSDETDSPVDLDNYGFTAELRSQLDERTRLQGSVDLTGLRPSELTENLRTTVGIDRPIGDHRLNLQYSYRERLFNGTLGFQDVQSSLGAVILSPEYRLGERGPRLTYQASSQLINAESDQDDLRDPITGRATLGRFQASASLQQNFNIWRGQPKPATQDKGLRFTPQPVIPYVDIISGLRTTGTYYTSGDFQNNLVAEVGVEGQLGHLSRNFGDYTRFRVGYSQSFIGGADSPFLFDREVDRNILTLGITQQVYGPILAGFQTALSLSENRAINNIYSLEYSRRTYGLLLRFDTVQSTGAIGFRLSNFSWLGDTDPFDSPRFRRVEGGVIER